MFGVESYLHRLGMDPQTGPPSVELLAALQLAHLVHVPFENLNVYHRREARTDPDWSVHKIVDLRRGGWCFEVNGAFGSLLRALGFSVDRVSCQVWEGDSEGWGPDFDHLGSVVHVEGERWFVDVGFGDCCLEPVLLQPGGRVAIPRSVLVETDDAHVVLIELMPTESGAAEWEPQLRVSFQPRHLHEFDGRSTHLQTYPGLSWQEKVFATRALDGTGSRVTLRTDLLRVRAGVGPFVDTPVPASEWSATLLQHFGLVDDLRQ